MIAAAPVRTPEADWIPGAGSHDENEQLKSVFWFHRQRSAGNLAEYAGRFVAIKGEEVIDSDENEQAMFERLEASYGLNANIIVKSLIPVPNWK